MNRLACFAILAGSLPLVLGTGCGTTPPTRLYVIEATTRVEKSGAHAGPFIAIGPIELPEQLNRKEIVTYPEPFRANASSLDRWAEPLDRSIGAALQENLSNLLPSDHVTAYPWRNNDEIDYVIQVRINAFGMGPGDNIALNATWLVKNNASGVLVVASKTVYSEQRLGDKMVDTVAAMSRAIERLSRDIANVLRADLTDVNAREADSG